MEESKKSPSASIKYEILIDKRCQKEISKLQLADKKRVIELIDSLAENPKPHTKNFRSLTGYNLYRYRIGNLRIIYSVDQEAGKIIIEKVRRRSESTYRLKK